MSAGFYDGYFDATSNNTPRVYNPKCWDVSEYDQGYYDGYQYGRSTIG